MTGRKIWLKLKKAKFSNSSLNKISTPPTNSSTKVETTPVRNQTIISKMDVSTETSTDFLVMENNQDRALIPKISKLDEANKSDFVCSLYVTACPTKFQPGDNHRNSIICCDLLDAIYATKPTGPFKVLETKCGLIATFTQESDADNLLLNENLAEVLHGPVQIARFSKDARYKQVATLRDVPWAIPTQDICAALTTQGISYENVDRILNNIRVEVLDANHYEQLISQGLNFFDATRFVALPERWYRNQNADAGDTSVLQCYRCQGFWHVAANCRHLPRCVRCGETHGVDLCPRPRNNPICCHCAGAHHAAYKNCPVRVQLQNAIPVSMSLSTTRNEPRNRT